MLIRLLRLTVMCVAFIGISGFGARSTALQNSFALPDKTLYEAGLEYLEKHQFIKARLAFQTLINAYPDSKFVASSYLKTGDSLFNEGGYTNTLMAEHQYKMFVNFFPAHPSAADAQMKVIDINMKLTHLSQNNDFLANADAAIDQFLKLFPDSHSIPVVKQLRNEVSRELANRRLSKIIGNIAGPGPTALKQVSISLIDRETSEVLQTMQTDEQGHFIIRWVPLERKVGLRMEKQGFMPYLYAGTDPYSSPLKITMPPASIEKVGMRGNRQISEERIRSYIRTRPGQSYDEAPLDSDIGALYKTNFFDYLDIEEMDGDTGKIITFILEEKPLIRSKEDADLSSALLKTKVPPASIERIEIRGNRRIPQERILSCIRTRPGQPYSQAQLVSDIGALYRNNFFDYLDIEERDGNTGKIITFILKEKPLIRTIEYKGNESFTEADILAAFRKNKVELSADSSSYDPRKVRAAEGILKELMIQHGKPRGTVRTEVESIPPLSVRLRFILNESGKELR